MAEPEKYVGEVYFVRRVDKGVDEVSASIRPKGFLSAVFADVIDSWENMTWDVPAGHGLAQGDQIEVSLNAAAKPTSIKVTKPSAAK